jgi:hypothetical protein
VVDLAGGTNRWTTTTRGQDSNFGATAISPDGRLLATSEGFGKPLMRFWDLATGKEIGSPLAAHDDWIDALRFLPDGRTLVSGGGDQTIRLWDVTDPQNVHPKGRPLLGLKSGVQTLALLPDGGTLVSGAQDGSVCTWEATAEPNNVLEVTLPAGDQWVFAPDAKSIFALESNHVLEWHGPHFQTKTRLFDLPSDAGDEGIFTDDGRRLVTISTNGVLQVCELPSGRLLRQFGKYTAGISLYHLYPVASSQNVVVAGDSYHVDLWNLDTFQLIGSWPHSIGEGNRFALSEEGEWLLSAEYGGAFTRINSATKESVTRQLDMNAVINMGFSSDGRQFAAGSWLGYVNVWQTDSFRPVAVVGSHRLPMFVAGFPPNGSRLLTCDYGTETLRLWDLKTQRELVVLEGNKADFKGNFNVQFSLDGNLLGVGYSGSLRVYVAPTLAEIDAVEQADAVLK